MPAELFAPHQVGVQLKGSKLLRPGLETWLAVSEFATVVQMSLQMQDIRSSSRRADNATLDEG